MWLREWARRAVGREQNDHSEEVHVGRSSEELNAYRQGVALVDRSKRSDETSRDDLWVTNARAESAKETEIIT